MYKSVSEKLHKFKIFNRIQFFFMCEKLLDFIFCRMINGILIFVLKKNHLKHLFESAMLDNSLM